MFYLDIENSMLMSMLGYATASGNLILVKNGDKAVLRWALDNVSIIMIMYTINTSAFEIVWSLPSPLTLWDKLLSQESKEQLNFPKLIESKGIFKKYKILKDFPILC